LCEFCFAISRVGPCSPKLARQSRY
jgi:hypothetical protein